jgi:tRNA-specific 2-thiouridylase
MHWINAAPALPGRFNVQARYRETPISAQITIESAGTICTFDEPHIASRGQSLVIYDGEKCLGGGSIEAL